jgi:beta-mannosidase
VSAGGDAAPPGRVIDLGADTWTVCAGGPTVPPDLRGRDLPARVPGCVHTDLIAAGAIPHPDDGFGERAGAWVGRTAWRYRRVFDLPAEMLAATRLDLVCEGLDTIAKVGVNGTVVGDAANMHHPHRFDIRDAARAGTNELRIAFRAPIVYAETQEAERGARPVNGDWGPYAYMRKAACNFGWDWGPQVPTVGIWRPIYVHAWDDARLRAVRPLVTRADAERAVVEVAVDVETAVPGARTIRAVLTAPDGSVSEGTADVVDDAATVRLVVDRPALWWPRGLGPQPRSRLDVALLEAERTLDGWSAPIGLRSVRLDTTPDEHGSAFAIEINGEPVFCKGANWIPNQLFPSDDSGRRTRERIEQAAAAEMNMLRVWGGGIYEEDAFYEACDELGILVWQDFMLACATYPEEPPYPALLEAEARHQVERLSRHPSIVLWCGGNEDILAYESWGWKEEMDPALTWGRTYWLELLPRVCAELDPTRPYWPDSPWGGSEDRHPNDPDHGDRHTWDARIEEYRDLVPRFVSEFGHQGPPCYATWLDAVGAEGCVIGSAAARHRQRAWGGDEREYDEPIAAWFGPPASFDAWHACAQLLQARAIALAIEWLRVNRPRCMGALFWQLNDCWAGHSWSAIDVAGRRKPLWYAVRRAFAPRLLSIHPVEGRPTLFAANDERTAWTGTVRVRRLDFDGEVRAETSVDLNVAPASAGVVADLVDAVGAPEDPRRELLRAEAAGHPPVTWFHRRDRDLALPAPRFTTETEGDGATTLLHVRAETVLRDIIIHADRIEPDTSVDEQLVTLVPGETWTFRLTGPGTLEPARLATPPVFTCVPGGRNP